MPGHTRLPLGVEVDIHHERMTLTTGDRVVANWPLDELEVSSLFDGFHVKLGGEEMILNVTDSKRFAAEMGVGRQRIETHHNGSHRNGRKIAPIRPVADGGTDGESYLEIRLRVAEIADLLASESVSPAEALARWLSLLKELNRLHGQGSISTYLYCQLNSQLLDLLPEPDLAPSAE